MRFTTLAEMFAADVTTPKPREYVSPDGSAILPAGRVFQQGPANDTSGWRFSDNLDTYGFVEAKAGERVYVSSESEDVTYSARVNPDGTLADLKPFAHRGGESVATDPEGNVYVANGQIFVYSPAGKQIAEIDVPERPLQLDLRGSRSQNAFHPGASRAVPGAGALTGYFRSRGGEGVKSEGVIEGISEPAGAPFHIFTFFTSSLFSVLRLTCL